MTVYLAADDVVRLNTMVGTEYPEHTTHGSADVQGVDCIIQGAFGSMYGQPLHHTIHEQAAALLEGLVRLHPVPRRQQAYGPFVGVHVPAG